MHRVGYDMSYDFITFMLSKLKFDSPQILLSCLEYEVYEFILYD